MADQRADPRIQVNVRIKGPDGRDKPIKFERVKVQGPDGRVHDVLVSPKKVKELKEIRNTQIKDKLKLSTPPQVSSF